ncbi:hypothetical protein GQ43DRAFT_219653 [Delitschia confertaspora ATCC 74209]|uniref:Uncharacterized protein n=1 Tax=Delitschia confertaspora ATCC 74209 TaxID=1513339 RepID=A0A9P4MRP3_9PLEO|nr:hypothetical protein GQ43DRAFT_219653 [Delitschia confertaspora ATCC 74209]
MSFAILQRAFNILLDHFYRTYKALARFGYHPRIWRQSIGVILPKPGKPDYSTPKSYRIISLLSTVWARLLKKSWLLDLAILPISLDLIY